MLKSNSISLAAALALAGTLTLVGCGDSASNNTAGTNPTGSTTQISQAKETGSISGSVKLINSPTKRSVRSDATAQIVAYNLDDNTKYTTTSTAQGKYDLSGLTEGHYQVIATSTSTTMRSIRQTTVQRDTRSVVNIVLQATGTIKGTFANSQFPEGYYYEDMIVSIPGTSYISTVDENGSFELINVPAGDVTISAPGYYDYISQNVTVTGGEVTKVPDFGANLSDVFYVSSLKTDSTLEMKYEGIEVEMKHYFTLAKFKDSISLVDANGTAEDIQVDYKFDNQGEESNYFTIKTTSLLKAGTYTLKIGKDYTKEIKLEDKVAIYSDADTNEGGVYEKNLGIAFSKPVADLNKSSITISYVDGNDTKSLPITSVEKDDSNGPENSFKIIANYDTNVKYKVTLDDNLSESGTFYVGDNGNKWNADGITIGDTRVSYVSVDTDEKNVPLTKDIHFEIAYPGALDLQTLKVMLGTKELTLKNGGLTKYNHYDYYNDYYYGDNLQIGVSTSSLAYDKNVTMKITANDSYGASALDKSVNFSTISPATVGVLPYVTSNDDDDDWLYNLSNNNSGVLQAYFNVPVDYKSGSITLHDNTHNKDVDVYNGNGSNGNATTSNNTSTPYNISANPAELLPNTEYTMTVAGYTATDGTKIPTKTNTFKTPARRIIENSVSNGTLREASNFNNRIEFATFGKLTDAEKKSFVNGVDITSFKTALPEDKSHPVPLPLWEDTPYGSKLILAFTIDKGTSYELNFNGDVAKELDMTASPLTFMTIGDKVSEDFTPKFKIINKLYTYDDEYPDHNLSKVATTVEGRASVTIPYIVDKNDNWHSRIKCDDLRHKNVYNESGYDDTPDLNASVIKEWMSGDDLNVTSTNLSVSGYNSHNDYDENGNDNSYYSCDVTYNADFSISRDINSSVSINVPVSSLKTTDTVATNFTAVDTNETRTIVDEKARAGVDIYNNSFIIYFSKPVAVSSLKDFKISTNPNLNMKIDESYADYYDADGNKYLLEIFGSYDSSAYSAFAYDINKTVKYFDVLTQTTGDLNITKSGVQYTTADLTPLKVNQVSNGKGNTIVLDTNREVDTNSVLTQDENGTITDSAFTLTNDKNDSNVTATVVGAYNNYNYSTNSNALMLNVNRSDSDGNCYDAMTFTLDQAESIKAEHSTQTLDRGSVSATITLPEDKSGCDD